MAFQVCAHRGASGTHPENTLLAFQAALELGVQRIEFDLRRTVDGELVILHDSSVDRTTDGSGTIWELTAAAVRSLDAGRWRGEEFAGQRIPTFAEALAACPVRCNLHVYPGPADLRPLVAGVVAEIRNQGRQETVFVTGDEQVVRYTAELAPELERCWLGGQHLADYPDRSAALGCRNLQPWYPNVSREQVARAHELGLTVHPFYADDRARMLELIDLGCDGLLTNQPALLLDLLREIGKE
ncbi:MAG: hypothetical protein IT204_10990 [Fimbriimonadaceae bacterium]|nr:hypothetical protein [Fimbriimonadaceae bacterium]